MMLRNKVWKFSAILRVVCAMVLCVDSASCCECRISCCESMKAYCLSSARGDSQSWPVERQYARSTTSTSQVSRT